MTIGAGIAIAAMWLAVAAIGIVEPAAALLMGSFASLGTLAVVLYK